MVAPLRLAGALLLLPAAAMADYARGVAAYGRGDYAAALSEFTAAARAGDAESQFMLGRLYAMGLGVPADLVQAWVWDERAARAGNAEANAARASIEAILTPAQLAAARDQLGGTEAALPPVPITDLAAFPPDDRSAPVPLLQSRLADGMPAVDGVATPVAPPTSAASQRRWALVPNSAHLSAPGPSYEGWLRASGGLEHQVADLQAGLNQAGYAAGPADGRLGPATRKALRDWQNDHGRSPTGIITPDVVAAVQATTQTAGR